MIRITGGAFRGRRIPVPAGVRPTTELARKAAFDVLGSAVRETRVLDAAAGSGAYGLEALSRGAKEAVFVEADRRTAARLRESLERLDLISRALVVDATVAQFARRRGAAPVPFDLVFFDPPWAAAEPADLEALLPLVAPGGTLVHERGDDAEPLAMGRAADDVRRYGRTRLLFYRVPR